MPGIPAAWCVWAHRRTRVQRVGEVLCSALCLSVRGKGERKREGRKEKGKRKGEKGKERREKEEKEKKKGDAGGIRGNSRDPGVASTRSDAHEKQGKQEKIRR